jgi:hypothetical protein
VDTAFLDKIRNVVFVEIKPWVSYPEYLEKKVRAFVGSFYFDDYY